VDARGLRELLPGQWVSTEIRGLAETWRIRFGPKANAHGLEDEHREFLHNHRDLGEAHSSTSKINWCAIISRRWRTWPRKRTLDRTATAANPCGSQNQRAYPTSFAASRRQPNNGGQNRQARIENVPQALRQRKSCGDVKTDCAEQQKNLLPKFLAWRLNNLPPSECAEDMIDEHLYLWVGCLELSPTSKKTHFLTALGEWGIAEQQIQHRNTHTETDKTCVKPTMYFPPTLPRPPYSHTTPFLLFSPPQPCLSPRSVFPRQQGWETLRWLPNQKNSQRARTLSCLVHGSATKRCL
jgi:hypothetical protein